MNDISSQTIRELTETLIEMQNNTLSGVYVEYGMTNVLGMDFGGNLGKGVGSKVAEIIPYWDKMMTIIKEWEKNKRETKRSGPSTTKAIDGVMSKLQSIIYKGLLRAENPNTFENLFVILDDVCDELSDNFFILDYENPNSSQPMMREDKDIPGCGNCTHIWDEDACLGTANGSACLKWKHNKVTLQEKQS